jgi:hypothetical protein
LHFFKSWLQGKRQYGRLSLTGPWLTHYSLRITLPISNPFIEEFILDPGYWPGNFISFNHKKKIKMKKLLIVIFLTIALGATITSCTSSRVGCKANANMVGYH